MPTPTATQSASQPQGNGRVQDPVEVLKPYLPIVAAVIGVSGVIGAAIITHRLAKRRDAIARFAAAAKDFRASFTPELAILESSAELAVNLDEYLLSAHREKHRLAIATFENSLSRPARTGFKAACQQYHSGYVFEGISEEEALFFEYQPGHPPTQKLMGRQLAALRIRELLAFARHE